MRTRRAAAVLAALLAASCGGGADPALHPDVASAVAKAKAARPELFRRKVVLLGFDSCDPDLVEQYVREGKLPNFARLLREGARGALASIQPTLSPVVWTTIATGMTPQRHGILDFFHAGPDGVVPYSSRQRQADAVWELLSGQGETVGVVGWLCTAPADEVNGFVVTERMGKLAFEFGAQSAQASAGRTWPESLAAELADDQVDAAAQPLSSVRPFLDITEEEFRKAYKPEFDPKNPIGNLRLTLATAETFRNVGERLHAERRPRFFACYFEAMDAISHLFMPYAPPKAPGIRLDEYMKYRTAIEANYIWHDQVLGEFMDQCDADTTVFVVSDHGFKNGDYRMADSSDFSAKTGAMWHRLYGVFYAWGDGVRPGARVDGASVYDVTPTILASMGYPVSDEMRGKVLESAFEGGLPHERVPTYRGEARIRELAIERVLRESAEGAPTARSPEDEDTMKRLETLGYAAGDSTDSLTTKNNEAIALMGQNRFEEAYQVLAKVLADAANRAPILLDTQTQACIRTGRLEEAEGLNAESLRKEPRNAHGMLMRTYVHLAGGRYADAEKSARDTLLFKGDVPANHQALATALEGLRGEAEKRFDAEADARLRLEIIQAYETALSYEPRQTWPLFAIARTRLDTRRPEIEDFRKAKSELDRVLEMNPNYPSALNNHAMALLNLALDAERAGRAEEADRLKGEALASAEKACSLAEDGRYGPAYKGYAKAWANKAYVLWTMNRIADAAAAARRVLSIEPDYKLNAHLVKALKDAGHVLAVVR